MDLNEIAFITFLIVLVILFCFKKHIRIFFSEVIRSDLDTDYGFSLGKEKRPESVQPPGQPHAAIRDGKARHARGRTSVALLIGIDGPVRGLHFSVDGPRCRIGRNAENDLRITGDEYVSGRHADLHYENGSLLLSDHQSRNGTFLNETRVRGSALVVRQGDRIRFGKSVFRVTEEHGGRANHRRV